MQRFNNENRKVWGQIILTCALLAAILFSFHDFVQDNNKRILAQNESYIADVTSQTAKHVDDMLRARQNSLDVIAVTVESTLEEPRVRQETLEMLQGKSSFDYIEFVDSTGLNHTANGKTSNSSDRENYLRGMQGYTGTALIFDSRVTHETLVDFYTPIAYEGEIIGVLNGMYREESLREIIAADFFGVSAKTYLCTKGGTVISAYGVEITPQNIWQAQQGIAEEDLKRIRAAFEHQQPYSYTYQGSNGTSNAYLMPLASTEWMLLQAFPSELNKTMLANANASGIELEARLLALFVLYVLCLLWKNSQQKKRLLAEKQKLTWIIEGILPLFSRFVIMDYERGTYEYLEDTERDAPERGSYEELMAIMAQHYIDEPDMEPMAVLLSRESVQSRLVGDRPYLQYEYRIKWEEERWENLSILSLKRKDGLPVIILLAIQDVTALKQWEQNNRQALQDAYKAAEEANHAKSDFLSRMSHDIRTPMNAIMGMTAIALMHLDDAERVEDCLHKIDSSSQHLLALINKVLDMSKIESGKLVLSEETFTLPAVMAETVAIIQPQADSKKQELQISFDALDHETVLGDPLRLRQLLVNILANAVKFTPKSGTIVFSVRELPSALLDSARYECVITDNGIGMEAAFIDQLFDPFSRSRNAQIKNIEGTGLGMPIAKSIAQMMNGDIRVESRPGQGSRFTVQIYLKLPPAAEKAAAQAPENNTDVQCLLAADYTGYRALLVEDNALNTEIAQELLHMAKLQVETAQDGQEAVDRVTALPPGYYDLILMDIQMPRKNGYEAARELRASQREDLQQIPIIAMSADAFDDDVKRALDAGMNDHVPKPIELDKLLGALAKWIE